MEEKTVALGATEKIPIYRDAGGRYLHGSVSACSQMKNSWPISDTENLQSDRVPFSVRQ